MKSRIAIAVSALMLGTALAAVPSFAQTRGARSGPEVQQESTGTVPQQESRGCIHFGQGCSNKPYPMAQESGQKGERTGTREARSASDGERIKSEQTSGNRERLSSERMDRERLRGGEHARIASQRGSVNERERVSVDERERLSGARVSERERTSGDVSIGARERAGVGERERLSGERFAGRDRIGVDTYGFGTSRRYYDYAPGVAVAGVGGGAIAWCETRFRSFDPVTGTYMGFDGIRHPCP